MARSRSRESREHRVTGEALDRELAGLLDVETFDPPAEFREHALLKDPAVYEQAARDPQAWWVEQAERLHWFQKWDTVLDDSNPPFYKWFTGGKLNVSYNCLDRHVEAGRGERVAFHWRGEDGSERDITYAELLAEVKRFASALKDLGVKQGRRGRDLPADDPRGGRGDARLRADRRAAQRRLRRLLRGGGARADGVLAGEGADHRRRRRAQGQDRAGEGSRGRGDGRPGDAREDRRRAEQGHAMRDAGGARRLLRRDLSRPPTRSARPRRWTRSIRCTSSTRRARRPSRRASCTRPAAI